MADQELSSLRVPELLAFYGRVLGELRLRGAIRSNNNPAADYAELLFCTAFGWTRQANSKKGYDAIDERGTRYQIKGRRPTVHNVSRQVSALRELDGGPFDVFAGVLFNEDFTVHRAVLIPHATVFERSKFVKNWGWRFHLVDALWLLPDSRDVTSELRAVKI